jgi:hypothetical protein
MENLIWVKMAPNKQNIGLFFSTRNGITKNKNPMARFLKPCTNVWFSFCKSKAFGKSLETFDSQIFSFSHAGMVFSRLLFFCIYYMLCSPPGWKRRQAGPKVPSHLLADRKKSIG